jgi:hypothetical protein
MKIVKMIDKRGSLCYNKMVRTGGDAPQDEVEL